MSGDGYTEAFHEFVSASIAVWREIDRLTAENDGTYPGLPQSTALRQRERAAWERFRPFLSAVGAASSPASRLPSVSTYPSPRCPGHGRHWFSVRGHVGLRSPICVRCGAANPKLLTTDDWWQLLDHPMLLSRAGIDPDRLRESLEDERNAW